MLAQSLVMHLLLQQCCITVSTQPSVYSLLKDGESQEMVCYNKRCFCHSGKIQYSSKLRCGAQEFFFKIKQKRQKAGVQQAYKNSEGNQEDHKQDNGLWHETIGVTPPPPFTIKD